MKYIRCFTFVVASFLLLKCGAAHAQTFSVSGLTLGISVSQAQHRVLANGWKALTCTTTGRGAQECTSFKVGDNKGGENDYSIDAYFIDAYFLDGSLCRVQFVFPRHEFDSMLSTLRKAYGAERTDLQGSTGGIYWEDPSGTVFLILAREGVGNLVTATLANSQVRIFL